MTNREKLEINGYEELVLFKGPDYDSAIIGVTTENCVVYDFDKMIECLVAEDGMSTEEAMDFICYDALRACAYVENAPIVLSVRIEDL